MQMLYDSDSFVVVHMQANEPAEGEPTPRIARNGFEIVDKRTLAPVSRIEGEALALIAARVGTTRLIDNYTIKDGSS